jgi:hypothetical protein
MPWTYSDVDAANCLIVTALSTNSSNSKFLSLFLVSDLISSCLIGHMKV